ncbi:hypothetical protein B0A48_08084 [Cryoendolithus antarcticus]|uniref:Sterol regulatory element-binding protein cleavage-activating protein n=1 Tax=Cryoendolithus antarcticus TaxID=1507870 RepID=A0A1V8T156_9PEZI|nr:hypothetical protein B0A48_08084 [Cryoendolithus antarcticus]
MIWFLLYPMRGTINPPRLADDHPIRRAFYRHGFYTAQHWLIAMLVSVAIGVALSYPTVFLSDNPTAGFTSMPRDVWTTAKPVGVDQGFRADVEMRQVWVHGSYMQALQHDVLKSALVIQQTLVGGETLPFSQPAPNDKVAHSELSWGYHSPLFYWNNSAETIECDSDVVRTVNEQSKKTSSLNVALRPASVLAGKAFHHRKLIAADALVLTLMNKVEDGVGGMWQDKMHNLEYKACENCTLYPPHGEISRSRLYEFSFKPISTRENLALAFAYGCMLLYVLLSLRRLRAFHSRFGLVVTAITQLTTSILASFTICGVLKINLATIPSNAYPFIVLVIGLENMFRMINAVLAYPPTMATDVRIANALGDIGPLSVATAIQNIIILWLLAIVVSPGVKAFCAFAAIATLFDSFFLLTFFVAVLNVDIRRLELQDSLSRSDKRSRPRRRSPVQRSWMDAMMHGRLPFSTRMAGSVVTTTFILSLNYHFFETREKAMSFRHLVGLFLGQLRSDIPALADFESFATPPMNVSITPGEWIRMQDFETAREVMRLVRPGASDFVIRIFSPLIVVLSGADRTGVPHGFDVLTDAVRSFALHHFYPFAMALMFMVTFVAVLMNFLLWAEASDTSEASANRIEEPLKVAHIVLPHRLDVVKIAGSPQGHFATVGLDRSIAVTACGRSSETYTIGIISKELTSRLRWPLHNIAISNDGSFLAMHCADDHIAFYSTKDCSLMKRSLRYPDDHPAVLFDFAQMPTDRGQGTLFVAITAGGRIATIEMEQGTCSTAELSARPLRGAVLMADKVDCRLSIITDDARVSAYSLVNTSWSYVASSQLRSASTAGLIDNFVSMMVVRNVDPLMLSIGIDNTVYFVDIGTLDTVLTMQSSQAMSHATSVMGKSSKCPACGASAFDRVAVIGDTDDGRTVQIATRCSAGLAEDSRSLCMTADLPDCHSLSTTVASDSKISNPGAWSSLSSNAILGIRQQSLASTDSPPNIVRNRKTSRQTDSDADKDEWEAYAHTLSGETHVVDLSADERSHESSLYVTEPGPTAALGPQSVAVAFGNCVKVLTFNAPRTAGPMWSAQTLNGDTRRRPVEARKVQ